MEKRCPHWHFGAPNCQSLTLGVTQKIHQATSFDQGVGSKESVKKYALGVWKCTEKKV